MRYILTLLLGIALVCCASSLLLVSCNQGKKQTGNRELPFFHFDQIDHYHTGIAKDDLQDIQMKQEKSRKEQALLQILTGNIPVSIKDTLFIKNMEILGFEKDTIDPGLHPKMTQLFSFREIDKPAQQNCTKVYRDVLIFRKDQLIVGIVKTSFDCYGHQMIGERYNDSDFGQSGEYQELEKILKE